MESGLLIKSESTICWINGTSNGKGLVNQVSRFSDSHGSGTIEPAFTTQTGLDSQ